MTRDSTTAPIASAYAQAKAEGRVALIPYIMVGYPDLATCEALALRLDQVGVDIGELGVPFSDLLADGAPIQTAHAGIAGVIVPDLSPEEAEYLQETRRHASSN